MGDNSEDVFLYYPDESSFYPSNGDQPSTLDLLVTKGELQPSDLTKADEMDSDHYPVLFKKIQAGQETRTEQKYRDYKIINWAAYRKEINKSLPAYGSLNSPAAIDKALDGLVECIERATKKARKSKR